jgi:hypothetical protein
MSIICDSREKIAASHHNATPKFDTIFSFPWHFPMSARLLYTTMFFNKHAHPSDLTVSYTTGNADDDAYDQIWPRSCLCCRSTSFSQMHRSWFKFVLEKANDVQTSFQVIQPGHRHSDVSRLKQHVEARIAVGGTAGSIFWRQGK